MSRVHNQNRTVLSLLLLFEANEASGVASVMSARWQLLPPTSKNLSDFSYFDSNDQRCRLSLLGSFIYVRAASSRVKKDLYGVLMPPFWLVQHKCHKPNQLVCSHELLHYLCKFPNKQAHHPV